MTMQRAFLLFLIFSTITLPRNALADSALKHKTVFGKTLSYLNQSRLMHLFEKFLAKLPKTIPYGEELASPSYQELGKEAQIAAGIPEEYHVPIKKFPLTHPLVYYVGAVAESDAIYVNEGLCNMAPYGACRALLFHEAIHKKYNEMACDSLLEFLMMSGFTYGTNKFIKSHTPEGKFTILRVIAAILSGAFGGTVSSLLYHHYVERRADIEGHYATNCSKCVFESAQQRRIIFEQQNNPLRNNGYLWADDLEIIAQDLENEHKICTFHELQFFNEMVAVVMHNA